jgi:hypothetical protein
MNRSARLSVMVLGALAMAVVLAGCYSSNGPLVSVGDTGYGPKPRAEAGNIPRGPEHQVCRDEMGKALDEVAKLEKDLDKCRRDRGDDKSKWEAEKKRLERERDAARDEANMNRKQLDRLRGH